MKISNKLVSIKIGNKQYDLKNLITNECLTRFARAQLVPEDYNKIINDKAMTYCLLKFDNPFQINENIELHNQDFNICLADSAYIEKNISENNIKIKYIYSSNFIWDYEKNTTANISDYYGKKITAIGFNSWFSSDVNSSIKIPVMSVVDTSNYNIYLQDKQDLKIVRQDSISTDAYFWSSNKKIKGPIHLIPGGGDKVVIQTPFMVNSDTQLNYENFKSYAFLYSVGLSSYRNYIDKEFIIGKDIEVIQSDNKLIFDGIENAFSDLTLLPLKNLYPASNIYPVKSNYRYVIFKYKVYQVFGNWTDSGNGYSMSTELEDTGYNYYQAIDINKFGLSNFKIAYERI